MQSDKEFVLDAMQRIGKTIAQDIQNRSAEMTDTELYAEEDYIPDFQAAPRYTEYDDPQCGQGKRLCLPVHGGPGGAADPKLRQR